MQVKVYYFGLINQVRGAKGWCPDTLCNRQSVGRLRRAGNADHDSDLFVRGWVLEPSCSACPGMSDAWEVVRSVRREALNRVWKAWVAGVM